MQGVGLQSGGTQVFFKKTFSIFVRLGKLRVECKGCHGNIFFFLTGWSHGTYTHILKVTANRSHAGSCLGALSASGVMGDSFSGAKGIRICVLSLTGKTPL